MLQHCAEILRAGILLLTLLRLLEQIVQVCADCFGCVGGQDERLISKVFAHLLGPKVLDHRKIYRFLRIPCIQKVHIFNHQAHAAPAGSSAFGG